MDQIFTKILENEKELKILKKNITNYEKQGL